MTTLIKTSLALFLGAISFPAFAQTTGASLTAPALKLVTVDMRKVYQAHPKTEEFRTKITADQQKAREEIERISKEINAMVDQYKEMIEQSKNPALTPEARTKAEEDSARKVQDIRRREDEARRDAENIEGVLRQRLQTHQEEMLQEISTVATDLSKKRGGTLLLNRDAFIYADASYDITDDVIKEIKSRPATPAPAAPSK